MEANVQSLRHTFGTYQVAKGTSLKTIQEVMGHKDPRTASLYLILAKELIGRDVLEHML